MYNDPSRDAERISSIAAARVAPFQARQSNFLGFAF
jgi:hypothetical protein